MGCTNFEIIFSKNVGARILSLVVSFHYGGKSNIRIGLYHMHCVVRLCMYTIVQMSHKNICMHCLHTQYESEKPDEKTRFTLQYLGV